MACSIDTAATGTFSKLTVVKDVPGNNGNSGASNEDFVSVFLVFHYAHIFSLHHHRHLTSIFHCVLTFCDQQPLVAEIPAGTACTGTLGSVDNVCLVKCQNPSGPFGGLIPIQISSGGASAAASANATANANTSDTGAAAGKKAGKKAGGRRIRRSF